MIQKSPSPGHESPPRKVWQPSLARTVFALSGSEANGREKRDTGEGWLGAVCNHGLSAGSYQPLRVAKGVCRVLGAPSDNHPRAPWRGINTRRATSSI